VVLGRSELQSQALAGLGWTIGRNVRMDIRYAGGDINRIRALAQELVGLQLDVILANTTPATVALHRETRTIPIVFVVVSDPVTQRIAPATAPSRPAGPGGGADQPRAGSLPVSMAEDRDDQRNTHLREATGLRGVVDRHEHMALERVSRDRMGAARRDSSVGQAADRFLRNPRQPRQATALPSLPSNGSTQPAEVHDEG
jgi:hypothetical protein